MDGDVCSEQDDMNIDLLFIAGVQYREDVSERPWVELKKNHSKEPQKFDAVDGEL